MKTFDIQTKFGPVRARVNGADEILIDTYVMPEHREEQRPVTIRGIQHTGNVRFGWTGTEWDGRTYDYDGNTVIFVSKHGTEYMESRAVWLNRYGSFGGDNATHAAKVAFYREMKKAVNLFAVEHKAELDAERRERKIERLTAAVESAQERRLKAIEEMKASEENLAEAKTNLEAALLDAVIAS